LSHITGIITAAGFSKRMGTLKALLPWKGTTMISHQINCLRHSGCTDIIVVLGFKSKQISDEIDCEDVIVVENNDYSYGRASSIKSGVRKSHFDTDCFVILGVDQPRNSEIISSLINSHLQSEFLITSPRYLGNGGHPIIISSKLRDELLNIDEETLGMKKIFEKYRANGINKVEFDDPLVRLDLNEINDYNLAYDQFGN
tara:strand:- start:147 stop:746 length:600 start_codon:yes stop_codon:yes gene_type:complete